MKTISNMTDLEISSYIKQVEDIVLDKRVQAMILVNPAYPLVEDAKTLEYRLKLERLSRAMVDLEEKWDYNLSDIVIEPMTREEMDLAFPELGAYVDAQEDAAAADAAE